LINNRLIDILQYGSESIGLNLSPGIYKAFGKYYEFLSEKGRNVNLTAISGVEDVAKLHFLDSISLINTYHFSGARIIDIGSGAGFPGVPLKIIDPSIDLTLLDATGKRIDFLSELCSILEIASTCIHDRAEEASRKSEFRDKYDIALSRAVARLNILCELCLPFICVGGAFIAMKTCDSDDELCESNDAIEALGGRFEKCIDYIIPGTDIQHRAIIIHKIESTPVEFPRKYAKMLNKPL
jgi:16S rRNA (guanine527-N7)-methyltransferase